MAGVPSYGQTPGLLRTYEGRADSGRALVLAYSCLPDAVTLTGLHVQVPLGVQHNDRIAPEQRFTPRHVVEKLSLQGIEVRSFVTLLTCWIHVHRIRLCHRWVRNGRWVSSSI